MRFDRRSLIPFECDKPDCTYKTTNEHQWKNHKAYHQLETPHQEPLDGPSDGGKPGSVFRIQLGKLMNDGWERESFPFPTDHKCEHCGSVRSTQYDLTKQIWVMPEVDDATPFPVHKHITVWHCDRCGNDQLAAPEIAKTQFRKTNKPKTNAVIVNGKKLTEAEVGRLIKLMDQLKKEGKL